MDRDDKPILLSTLGRRLLYDATHKTINVL